jgi:hypothetical protein
LNQHGIPHKVEAFVLKYIHSIEQLEVLLLLRKESDREWSAEDVSATLRTNPVSAAGRLADLKARKLISKRANNGELLYLYTHDVEVRELVDDVAKFYASHRHAIIELIYLRPAETLRVLADAFRIWKDDE